MFDINEFSTHEDNVLYGATASKVEEDVNGHHKIVIDYNFVDGTIRLVFSDAVDYYGLRLLVQHPLRRVVTGIRGNNRQKFWRFEFMDTDEHAAVGARMAHIAKLDE